jgi:hypothetical protein
MARSRIIHENESARAGPSSAACPTLQFSTEKPILELCTNPSNFVGNRLVQFSGLRYLEGKCQSRTAVQAATLSSRRGAARRADPGKSVGGAQDWRHRSQGPGASRGRSSSPRERKLVLDCRATSDEMPALITSQHHNAYRRDGSSNCSIALSGQALQPRSGAPKTRGLACGGLDSDAAIRIRRVRPHLLRSKVARKMVYILDFLLRSVMAHLPRCSQRPLRIGPTRG